LFIVQPCILPVNILYFNRTNTNHLSLKGIQSGWKELLVKTSEARQQSQHAGLSWLLIQEN
jgi:hypothetical protein